MRDPELMERLERDLELLLRVSNALPKALHEAAELSHPLRGTSYDSEVVSGGRSQIWCEVHEQEVHKCWRVDLPCRGVPVKVSDPTGEAAVAPSKVSITRLRIESTLSTLHKLVEPLVADVAWLTRTPETHKEARRREEERRDLAGENTERCRSCERTEQAPGVRRGIPVYRRTDGKGALPEPIPLCSWCHKYLHKFRCLPTTHDIDRHHAGQKIYKPAE